MRTAKAKARVLFVVASYGAVILPAHAQTPPDAGSLSQQIDKERPAVLPAPKQTLDVAPPTSVVPEDRTDVMQVSAFRFEGDLRYSEAELSSLLQGWLQRPVTLGDLQDAAAAVAARYRQDGWVVDVRVPPQEVTDGVVVLRVQQARMGEVRVEAPTLHRYDPASAQRRLADRFPVGQPINAEELNRALLLLDDLPGVEASGQLVRGQVPQETDLVLKLRDGPLIQGAQWLDNYGSRSTGANRISGDVEINSPMQLGDQLSVYALHSEDSNYLRAAYSVPVGGDGWRVGANASTFHYHLGSPEFVALHGRGYANSFGLDGSYPLLRSQKTNLSLNLGADLKQFDNEASGSTTSHYRTNSVMAGLSGNRMDDWSGGGVTAGSLQVSAGWLNDGTHDAGEDPQLERPYQTLRYQLSRTQRLASVFSAYASLSGQFAPRTLDSSARFFLGGPNGVRAYPADEGGGSDGMLANLELRARLPEGITVTEFLDWGQVRQQVRDVTVGTNVYSLAGYGASLGWTHPTGMTLKLIWAHRIGSNPNPTAAGRDQDGSRNLNQFWLMASVPFEW